MSTSTSHGLFTFTDFVFCKSGVLLFLHHQDAVLYWNVVFRTICPCSKNVQHWMGIKWLRLFIRNFNSLLGNHCMKWRCTGSQFTWLYKPPSVTKVFVIKIREGLASLRIGQKHMVPLTQFADCLWCYILCKISWCQLCWHNVLLLKPVSHEEWKGEQTNFLRKVLKQSWLPVFWKKIQNTQEIKKTLFN